MEIKVKTTPTEIKLQTNSNHFKSILGLVDRENLTSFYIQIASWVGYDGNYKEYKLNVLDLNNKIHSKIKKLIKESVVFDYNFILDFKIKKDLKHKDKIVYSSVNITLKQKSPNTITDIEELKPIITGFNNQIIWMLDNSTYFEFSGRVKVL